MTVRPLSFCALLLALSFVVACGGGYVDTEANSFVDRDSAGGFDRESVPTNTVPTPTEPVVVNSSSNNFVPPPAEPAPEQSAQEVYAAQFTGRSAVSAWVWNDRGSQKVLLPDGSSLPIQKLGITLSVKLIGSNARDGDSVVFVLDSKQLPAMHENEQVNLGRTYIYVTDIYVQ